MIVSPAHVCSCAAHLTVTTWWRDGTVKLMLDHELLTFHLAKLLPKQATCLALGVFFTTGHWIVHAGVRDLVFFFLVVELHDLVVSIRCVISLKPSMISEREIHVDLQERGLKITISLMTEQIFHHQSWCAKDGAHLDCVQLDQVIFECHLW